MVAGLVTPTAGTLTMDGRKITAPAPEHGLVFQEYALFPWMTVLRNVNYRAERAAASAARPPKSWRANKSLGSAWKASRTTTPHNFPAE